MPKNNPFHLPIKHSFHCWRWNTLSLSHPLPKLNFLRTQTVKIKSREKQAHFKNFTYQRQTGGQRKNSVKFYREIHYATENQWGINQFAFQTGKGDISFLKNGTYIFYPFKAVPSCSPSHSSFLMNVHQYLNCWLPPSAGSFCLRLLLSS